MPRAALLLALPLLSCACPPVSEPPAAERDAIDAFKAAWTAEVMPAAPEKEQPMAAAIDASMRAGRHPYSAKLEPCRGLIDRAPAANRVTGHDFVVFGSPAAVDRDGACWAVMYHGGMKHEVLAALDERRALLVVWRLPEG